ncbi:MAG: GNAT family N-acetyltransferase [Candidatus Omnitrophica bacterium]|nr:GNAT family N-acetyltransferase [Candidatus Omnitrophota bacterium]
MYEKIKTKKQIDALVAIAYSIWNEHFSSMFDKQTLAKIIKVAQSKKTIVKQISDNYQYFFINQNNKRIGYFAYKIDEEQRELFLSKIYIQVDQRGKGIGRKVLQYLEGLCFEYNLSKMTLTVYHKNTNSIKAYENWGFLSLGMIDRKFDNGLIFEDVKMEKSFK